MKILIIFSVSLILNLNICFPQTPLIDSLRKELERSKRDTIRVIILNNFINALVSGGINVNQVENYAKEALNLSRELNFKKGIALSYTSLAFDACLKNNYTSALENYWKSMEIFEDIDDKANIAATYINIGNVFRWNFIIEKSLDYYLKALNYYEKYGTNLEKAKIYSSIAFVYKGKSEYNKALEYLYIALNCYKNSHNKDKILSCLLNLTDVFIRQSDTKNAMEYLNQALRLSKELGNNYSLSICLSSIGLVYENNSDYIPALKYFKESLKIDIELKNNLSIINNLENIGGILFIQGKYKPAINYLKRAELMEKELNTPYQLMNNYNTQSKVYRKMGNFNDAINYKDKFIAVRDSVFNLEKLKLINNLDTKRETELREKEIELLKEKNKQNKIIIWSFIAGGVMLTIFVLFLFKERKKSEKLLLNILPSNIAKRLMRKEYPIADYFQDASVIFIDIVDFTKMSAKSTPQNMVNMLNNVFTIFDKLSAKFGLEKIKTIGDCYMAASGIPLPNSNHAQAVAKMALEVLEIMKDFQTEQGDSIKFRIGLDCGPIVAGVIGEQKYVYDLWGDTVNTASRMEEYGEIGKIQCTERFKETLSHPMTGSHRMTFAERGEIEIKGKGMMRTWFLEIK